MQIRIANVVEQVLHVQFRSRQVFAFIFLGELIPITAKMDQAIMVVDCVFDGR